MIRYEIRQQEIGRTYKEWSSTMRQVAASPLEAVVSQYPGMRVESTGSPSRYTAKTTSGTPHTIQIECKPTRL